MTLLLVVLYYSLTIAHHISQGPLNQITEFGGFDVARSDFILTDLLTVGAEKALKLDHQANQMKLPQKAFVLHSCI